MMIEFILVNFFLNGYEQFLMNHIAKKIYIISYHIYTNNIFPLSPNLSILHEWSEKSTYPAYSFELNVIEMLPEQRLKNLLFKQIES